MKRKNRPPDPGDDGFKVTLTKTFLIIRRYSGLQVIRLSEIWYVEFRERRYTCFFLRKGEKGNFRRVDVYAQMQVFQKALSNTLITRISRNKMVNLDFLDEIGAGHSIKLLGRDHPPMEVSKGCLQPFYEKLERISYSVKTKEKPPAKR